MPDSRSGDWADVSDRERRLLERFVELEGGWQRKGYRGIASSHHFRPPVSDLGLGSDREIRKLLNGLVDKGVLEPVRDGRYKCWRLRRV